jgi:hypothetical protein
MVFHGHDVRDHPDRRRAAVRRGRRVRCGNNRDALARLDDDEKGVCSIDTPKDQPAPPMPFALTAKAAARRGAVIRRPL